MKLLAPAKINLSLYIFDRLENGYHNLCSIMEKVSLFDEIEIEKRNDGKIGFNDPKNLVFRAASALQAASGTKFGVDIQLTKKIPMGAGLGGGSSDAATVLTGLNQLWELEWPLDKLTQIGAKLGSDIPVFLENHPGLVEKSGEKVTFLPKLPTFWAILIYPGVHVATPWAYQALDEYRATNRLTVKNQHVSVPRTFGELLKILHNDFEEVVFGQHPEIRFAKETLGSVGAEGVLMSGSGSTVFGLFATEAKRDRALEKLEMKPSWQCFKVENNWGVDKR